MKNRLLLTLLGLWLVASASALPQVVDEIYAIVNEEMITLSDIKAFELSSLRELESRLSGEDLEKAKADLKKNLMNLIVSQKLVTSKLKEKNYNVDAQVEMIIQEIKKQNSIASDEDLKNALQAEGVDFNQWKEQMREFQKIRQLKYDEIGSKVKIDNAQLLEFYRAHSSDFTIPEEVQVNAIYLKKEENAPAPTELMDKIKMEIKAENFAELAKAHSQLAEAATTPLLGRFKKGEIAKELDGVIEKMKVGEISGWIDAAKGWYIVQLAERQEAKLREFRDVRNDIENAIRDQIENDKFQDYLAQLKKESYVKILKAYTGN